MKLRHFGFDVHRLSWQTVGWWARKYFLPTPGTVILILLLLWAQSVGAIPGLTPASPRSTVPNLINYQGRLTDPADNPVTDGRYDMVFALYRQEGGGTAFWSENRSGTGGVQVTDGLFHVLLGEIAPINPADLYGDVFLGIRVGADPEMTPRERLTSVPFAMQVADGSVTTAQIADGAVTATKLNLVDGQVSIGTTDALTPLRVKKGNVSNVGAAEEYQLHISAAETVTTQGLAFGDKWDTAAVIQSFGRGLAINPAGNGVGIGTLHPNATLDVNGGLAVSGNLTLGGGLSSSGLSVSAPGLSSSSLRVANTGSGGAQWNIFTGDNGCFGDNLGIAPTVPVGTGLCGGDLGYVIVFARNGDAWMRGSFQAGGTKSAVVEAGNYGQRKLYAIEAPDVRFSDQGLARLNDGVVRVNLDPVFAETIEGEYLIHVTPYGDASLYVAEIGRDYFIVRARDGDPDVAFAWMLTATRKGYSGVRLEEAKSPGDNDNLR
jgi:hypothetical protein